MRKKAVTTAVVLLLVSVSCAPNPRFRSGDTVKVPRYGGKSQETGKSKPRAEPGKSGTKAPNRPMIPTGVYEEGIASYYGPNFHGKLTANGEVFDQNGISAAHKVLPFDTMVKVTNLDNGKSLVVRINDRGPFVGDRIIDLSKGAAERIGMLQSGTARVRLEIVP